jgi:sugar (pentulose or hexulose) kinase/phosphoglycerate dehydrogenase-like enzyme
MAKRFLAALDAGGGSGRCLLLDVDTGSVITAKRDWSHPVAPDTAGLGYDLNLPRIWNRLGEACREVVEKAGAHPGEVIGVAATSMRNTTVILDQNGQAVFSTPNQDARALGEALGLGAERGEEIHATGGHWPSPLFTGARLLWMKGNADSLLKRASTALSLSDWLGYRLCGEARAERSQAGETLLYDLKRDDWSEAIVNSLGLPQRLLPPTVDAGTCIGNLSEAAASHLGLSSGIPVAAGGGDTQCGLLGAGVLEPRDLGVIAGTTLPIQMVTNGLVLDRDGRLWSGRHVIPGLYVLESNGLTSGYVLEWFASILFQDYDHPLRVLFAEAARSEPGASGIYSTLGTNIFDARTIGIPQGNLTMSHMVSPETGAGRRHISRALLEGLAYSVRANVEQLSEAAGTDALHIFVTGGMSMSPLWTRILSDVLGRELTVSSTPEASSLGAAICAGVGAGAYADLASGAREVAGVRGEEAPGGDTLKYHSLYGGWREAFRLREQVDAHLSGLMAMAMLERAPQVSMAPGPSFRPRIMVTADMDEAALGELRELGEVTYAPWREKQVVHDGGSSLIEALRGYRIFVTEMDILDFEAIRGLPELKAVVSCRVNPVNVDLECATAHGIPVMNTPGRNADAVADLTLCFMIMLARGLQEAAGFLKLPGGAAGDMARMAEAYFKFQGRELWRKTVGVIGLGEVGARVASRVRACGANVLFYDPGITAEAGALLNAQGVSLEELLSSSDFVTMHAPATEATEGMLDGSRFSQMKQGAFFINTARASLVDGDALAEALSSGHLAGAALDVFPVEPPAADDPLASRVDVIATPHLGGNTREVSAHQGVVVAEQLRKLLRGEVPDHLLNPEVLKVFDWTIPRPQLSAAELDRLAARPRPSMTS